MHGTGGYRVQGTRYQVPVGYRGHPGQQHNQHQHAAQKILLNTLKMFDSYSKGTFEYEYSRNSPKKSNFEYRIRIEYYHYYPYPKRPQCSTSVSLSVHSTQYLAGCRVVALLYRYYV